jgi:hypothetical protein
VKSDCGAWQIAHSLRLEFRVHDTYDQLSNEERLLRLERRLTLAA